METLILASASPRRSELLSLAGIPFEICTACVDEQCAEPAASAVRILSARKALAVSGKVSGRFVLAATEKIIRIHLKICGAAVIIEIEHKA